MKHLIADMLIPPAQTLYEIVSAIPMWMVRIGVFGILALLALWVFMMKPQLPESADRGTTSSWNDLRIFALAVLVLQAVFYLIF